MIRRLGEVKGNMVMEPGTAGDLPEAYTYVALVRFYTNGGMVLCNGVSGSGLWGYVLRRFGAKTLQGGWSGSLQNCEFAKEIPNETWVLVAISKPAGTVKGTAYFYRFDTEEWESKEATTNGFNNPNSNGHAKQMQIGSGTAETNNKFDIAAAAVYNTALSKANLESLVAAETLEDWKTLFSPRACWTFGQREPGTTVLTAVRDWTGNGALNTANENTEALNEAPPIPYSDKEQITYVLVTDSLKHAAMEANFTALPWQAVNGSWSATLGWSPTSFTANPPHGGRSGWYINNQLVSGGNACSGFKIFSESSGGGGRQKAAWLFIPGTPPGTATGYQLALVFDSVETSKIDVFIREFSAGSLVKSVELPNWSPPALTGEVMLSAWGGILRAWYRQEPGLEWTELLSMESTSFTEGRCGMDGNGSNPRFQDFKMATLEGPPVVPPPSGKKVKVLKEGSIVEGKRYVLRNNELVNA